MNEITDDIINQAAVGHRDSFEAIYQAFSSFVYNVALRVVQNQQDAEEITQDVFLTLYKKLGTFRGESSFKTWIYRITMNITLNYIKKENRNKNKTVAFDESMTMVESSNNIASTIQKEDHECYIQKLLDLLNPDQRACIVLRSIEGLSYQQISDVLKVNINTVRTRIKRAREVMLTLRKEVAQNEL